MLRVEGRIANHDREFEGAIEINTETGLIEQVGPRTGNSDLDLRGQIIFPGFGDLHIHAREDASQSQVYQENFATVSAAAIHGGVTHVADMPNNPVAPVDDASYAQIFSFHPCFPFDFVCFCFGLFPFLYFLVLCFTLVR